MSSIIKILKQPIAFASPAGLLLFFVSAGLLESSPGLAEPMHFESETTGGNHCCQWIQATGDISEETATNFERFFKNTQFVPHAVRLNSPGGRLAGGILLGQKFRELGVSTEVGSSTSSTYEINSRKFKLYSEAPGYCASACAYAYLGGVARTLDEGSKIGFHRFYTHAAIASSSNKYSPGKTWMTLSGLLLPCCSMS